MKGKAGSGKRESTKTEIIIRQVLKANKLHKIGNSYMTVIPFGFLKSCGEEIEGAYWVKIESGKKPNTLTITAITMADIEGVITIASDTNRKGDAQDSDT